MVGGKPGDGHGDFVEPTVLAKTIATCAFLVRKFWTLEIGKQTAVFAAEAALFSHTQLGRLNA
jgi:hypothetical protein